MRTVRMAATATTTTTTTTAVVTTNATSGSYVDPASLLVGATSTESMEGFDVEFGSDYRIDDTGDVASGATEITDLDSIVELMAAELMDDLEDNGEDLWSVDSTAESSLSIKADLPIHYPYVDGMDIELERLTSRRVKNEPTRPPILGPCRLCFRDNTDDAQTVKHHSMASFIELSTPAPNDTEREIEQWTLNGRSLQQKQRFRQDGGTPEGDDDDDDGSFRTSDTRASVTSGYEATSDVGGIRGNGSRAGVREDEGLDTDFREWMERTFPRAAAVSPGLWLGDSEGLDVTIDAEERHLIEQHSLSSRSCRSSAPFLSEAGGSIRSSSMSPTFESCWDEYPEATTEKYMIGIERCNEFIGKSQSRTPVSTFTTTAPAERRKDGACNTPSKLFLYASFPGLAESTTTNIARMMDARLAPSSPRNSPPVGAGGADDRLTHSSTRVVCDDETSRLLPYSTRIDGNGYHQTLFPRGTSVEEHVAVRALVATTAAAPSFFFGEGGPPCTGGRAKRKVKSGPDRKAHLKGNDRERSRCGKCRQHMTRDVVVDGTPKRISHDCPMKRDRSSSSKAASSIGGTSRKRRTISV